jgi:hypothetical protein
MTPILLDFARKSGFTLCKEESALREMLEQFAKFIIEHEAAKQPDYELIAWATTVGSHAHVSWGKDRPDYPIRYEVPSYTTPPAQPAPVQDELAYREAVSLATWLFKKHFAHEEHYASGRVVWEPCDTTAGVISQIDNMVCGLVQPAATVKESLTVQPAAPVQEPVAWMDALKDAFFEGFTSVETYNDSRLNSPEEAWAKYKPPVIPPAASVQQEPVGRVVSANCEYATVQWLRQTSEVGGGDPKNSRSWPIAGDAVYTTPPAAPVQDIGVEQDERVFARIEARKNRDAARKETVQRQWVGLTPHQRMMCRSYDVDTAIDKTEAKLKELNT